MGVRSILCYPDLRLRSVALHVDEINNEHTQTVIADLLDTLNDHVGVGIAAPQIGVSLRIIAIDATRARRPVPNHGQLVLINPEIVHSEGEISFREGCLSVPDLVAHIRRPARITVNALTQNGERLCFDSEGFEAVILQHEIDHLNGKLFIDRVKNARDLKVRR